MRCSASVSGFYVPSVRYGSCRVMASSFGVRIYLLKYDWTHIEGDCYSVVGMPGYRCFYLLKYDWTHIEGDCYSVVGIPGYRCCAIALCSHLLGFSPSSMGWCRTRVHSSSWDDLLDHVFTSFSLVKVVSFNLCPLPFL